MRPVTILASGMVTAVGSDAPSTCAAIRCAIDNFTETRFMDNGGEWLMGAQVQLQQPWRGLSKLVHMVVPAIRECLDSLEGLTPEQIPLLLCVAEDGRPGRLEGLDDQLFQRIQAELDFCFHPQSTVIAKGRIAGALALALARRLMYEKNITNCIIAGVDSYLIASTLSAYEEQERLLSSQNSNGFLPGEAGTAILVGRPECLSVDRFNDDLICLSISQRQEKATVDSEEPLRGDGLVAAIKGACEQSDCKIGDLDYRITDANGEQYWFKEAALALDRILRNRKELFDIWHPSDCVGEIGAAIGPCIFGVALQAHRKRYAFGRGPLCHFGSDDGQRIALVFRSDRKEHS